MPNLIKNNKVWLHSINLIIAAHLSYHTITSNSPKKRKDRLQVKELFFKLKFFRKKVNYFKATSNWFSCEVSKLYFFSDPVFGGVAIFFFDNQNFTFNIKVLNLKKCMASKQKF